MLIAEPHPIIAFLLQASLFCVSLFLILVVLVQRGKGGGLTGALGGAGGQSAFGTKAGDVFTKFTVGLAITWILLCLLTIQLFTDHRPQPQAADEASVGAVDETKELADDNGTTESLDDEENRSSSDTPSGGDDTVSSDSESNSGSELSPAPSSGTPEDEKNGNTKGTPEESAGE